MQPGIIRFRGYAIEDLIGRVTFPQMIWLVTRGELPSAAQAALLDAALMAGVDHGPQAPSIAIARMILFPSICPETFSYVVEEMMLLRMPIAAFDLGAPGERLQSYELGRLCASVDAAAMLATMLDFHHDLATRETAVT